MEAQDVLKKVEVIEEEKTKKGKIENKARKEREKESFYRCKTKCACKEDQCAAKNLKECPKCHSIMSSVCGKAAVVSMLSNQL